MLVNEFAIDPNAVPAVWSYLQVAFSFVTNFKVVWVVPEARLPVGDPPERPGAVVSTGGAGFVNFANTAESTFVPFPSSSIAALSSTAADERNFSDFEKSLKGRDVNMPLCRNHISYYENRIKEKEVLYAIKKHIKDQEKLKKIFEIVKNQPDY